MSSLIYYCVDTETTGLKAKWQEITEMTIVRASDKMTLTQFIKCDFPMRASIEALRITNKTLADLSAGKSKEEAVEVFDNFLNQDGLTPAHRCYVGHNVSFDRKFIHALYESVGKECPVHLWVDTLELIKEFLKQNDISHLPNIAKTATGKVSTKLQACCDIIGIKRFAAAHASKVDAQNTYLLWRRLVEEKGIDHLPFHKTFIHKIKEDERLSVEDLDMSDIYG